MKKLIIVILFLSGVLDINAQEVILKKDHNITELHKGAYYRLDPEYRKKYTGIWISEDNKLKISITTKKAFLEGPDIYMEKLIGNYCYDTVDCNSDDKFSLSVGSIDYEDGITAEFIFNDEKKNKLGNAKLKLIEGDKAKWTLTNRREGLILGAYDRSFSVPTEAIMTRVE